MEFLDVMGPELRKKRVSKFFSLKLLCIIITRNLKALIKRFLDNAKKYNRWLLRNP